MAKELGLGRSRSRRGQKRSIARIAFRDTRVAATLMEEACVRPAIFQSGVG